MDDKRFAIVEVGQDIFRAAAQMGDPSSGQVLDEAGREGDAQVAASGLDPGQTMALKHGLQSIAYGFDFGQFGHGVLELAGHEESQHGTVAQAAPAGYCPRAMTADTRTDVKKTASFGFREVPEAEKEGLVREVFSSVARNYDIMNDLMSGGVHRLWKDAMVEWLNPRGGWKVLDVAGGTGDIAFRIAEFARERGGEAEIAVCDINADMLNEGVARAAEKGERHIEWVCGDAEKLPIPDASMDAYTIAFGIRNVTHIDRALAEARRVLKPGGRFLCLEFSRVEAPILDEIYDRYSFTVLPKLGEWVAKDADSYRYLAESIRRFPPQAKFAKMIAAAGLSQVKVRNMAGGVAAMHSAWRV